MTALALFESFCWGVTGGSTVLITQNGAKIYGYRKARKDHRRGADPEVSPGTSTIQVAGAGESPSADVAPDLTEPIIVFRVWQGHPSRGDGQLFSTNAATGWTAREKMTASCHVSGDKPHAAPDSECSCGIYAVKNELEMPAPANVGGPFAWGRVAIWGRVVEAEKGYRAQYAYPISIVLVNDERRVQQQMSSMQGGITTIAGQPQVIPPIAEAEMERWRASVASHYGVPVRTSTREEFNEMLTGKRYERDEKLRLERESMGIPAEVQELVG